MTSVDANTIISDPAWLPLRYDRSRDEIVFARLDRSARRRAGLLSEIAAALSPAALVRLSRVLSAGLARARAPTPVHIILHSGLTASTLLAASLDQEGVATSLKEPPILSDLAHAATAGMAAPAFATLVDDVLILLARPYEEGEAVVVKSTSSGNLILAAAAQRWPTMRVLALHAQLPAFLAALAGRELEGRIWARRFFNGLDRAGQITLGLPASELAEHTDLQVAADAWLTLHRTMGWAANRMGAGVVRTLTKDRLLAEPETSLERIATHFGLQLNTSRAIADVWERHAKTGNAFDAHRTTAESSAKAGPYATEIDSVTAWAGELARVQKIAMVLPHPL